MIRQTLVAPHVERLRPYVPGRSIDQVRRELGLETVLKLASNENPFGPSPKGIEAMARALPGIHRYPDDANCELREVLAERHRVDRRQIVFGAGITDLINLAVHTFTGPQDHAVVSAGSFIAYSMFLDASAVPATRVPLRDNALDLDAMAAAVRPETRLIFLPNPNNPTGSRFSGAALAAFVAKLPEHPVLFLDEAYFEYLDRSDQSEPRELIRRRPRTVVARGFSKAQGLAGARLGYLLCAPELADVLERVRRPFGVNALVLEGARAALDDREHLERTLTLTREGRRFLSSELGGLGFDVLPSAANFVTIAFATPAEAESFAARLLRRGLIVRHLASFAMPSHVRVTVGTPEENAALVDAASKRS